MIRCLVLILLPGYLIAGGSGIGSNCKNGSLCLDSECDSGLFCDTLQTPCRCEGILPIEIPAVPQRSAGHTEENPPSYTIYSIRGDVLPQGLYGANDSEIRVVLIVYRDSVRKVVMMHR